MKIILFFGYTNNLLYLCTISNEKTTFMKNYTIKHIHQDVSHFNGRLYFTLDGRLLILTVGTPNFNDYGEWRLEEFKFSKFPYDPEGDEASVILSKYNNLNERIQHKFIVGTFKNEKEAAKNRVDFILNLL